MKAERDKTISILHKYFPKPKCIKYEKAIYDLANKAKNNLSGHLEFVEFYRSVAYERLGQLINAKDETERNVILIDMQGDAGEAPVWWGSTVYDVYKEKYDELIMRTQQKPKPVKGVHKCKDPKCGSDEFYMWSLQTRSSDEPMTNFRQCVKCGKRGRE